MLSADPRAVTADPGAAAALEQFQQLGEMLHRIPPAECEARLASFQKSLVLDVWNRLQMLRSVANPEVPSAADLPAGLVKRFMGRTGKQLLRVYSKGNVWDNDAMKQFIAEIRSVDPNVTGNPIQIYEASRQMETSYEKATFLALSVVVPVVFFSFNSVRHTLLALLPLVAALVQTLGAMALLKIPLNQANMISLSLMLGMGMDNGVYVMQDYRSQKGRYRMNHSTAVAVVLCTLTTMIGFAALMVANHRGLQSLGRVLTIGMTFYLFSAWIMLPCLLTWLTRNRPDPQQTYADDPRDQGNCAVPGRPHFPTRQRKLSPELAEAIAAHVGRV